jgi:hypothetical protein
MSIYSTKFYEERHSGSLRSARTVVPTVLELLQPRSIVDVGCGDGTWLTVFRDCGVEDILGVDGDWVDQLALQIPLESFLRYDLSQPLHLNREFDLVVSLEVAEHLPKECAETFVDSLVRLGPCILFSAAVPRQGGLNHFNEEWQDYWANYFQARGYLALDVIRKHIWNDASVEFWYAQNTILYIKPEVLQSKPLLQKEYEHSNTSMLQLVHPRLYLMQTDLDSMSLREILLSLPRLFIRSIKAKIRKYFNS